MEIVSVQSRVSWGYVGNSMAVPVANALGAVVWPIDTVALSFHPGHGPSERIVSAPETLQRRMTEVCGRCEAPRALLIGYLGTAAQGDAILTTWNDLGSPGPVIFDPACGDDPSGLYVDESIARFFAEHAPSKATVMTPNRFELAAITGLDIQDVDDAILACERLRRRGPEIVIATSIPMSDGGFATLCDVGGNVSVIEAEWVETGLKGAGDCLTAAFASRFCNGAEAVDSVRVAVHATETCIGSSVSQGLQYLDPNTLAQRNE